MRVIKKIYHQAFFLLAGMLLITVFATPALAVDNQQATNRSGSLTVIETSSNTGNRISGVELTIHKVGNYSNHNFSQLELTDEFKESGINLNDISTADKQQQSSKKLENYIKDVGIVGLSKQKTNTEGKALFDNLGLGLYLVRVTSTSGTGIVVAADSFLISIPTKSAERDEWIYDVVTEPKSITITEEDKITSPVSVKLKAIKTLDDETPKGSAYTFILRNKSGDVIQTKNNKEKSIDFDPIQYTKEGKYIYTIEEWANPNFNSIIFDDSIYQVTINVNQRDDKLVQSIKYNKNGEPYSGIPVFENKTVVNPTPTPDIPNDSGKIPQTGQNFLRVWFFISLGLLMIFTGYRTWLRERTYYEK